MKSGESSIYKQIISPNCSIYNVDHYRMSVISMYASQSQLAYVFQLFSEHSFVTGIVTFCITELILTFKISFTNGLEMPMNKISE